MEAVGETVTLQPDVGQTLTLPAGQVQRLLEGGAMQMIAAAADGLSNANLTVLNGKLYFFADDDF